MSGSPDSCHRFQSASKLAASNARMEVVRNGGATVEAEITSCVACSLRDCPVIAIAVIRGQHELTVDYGRVTGRYVYPEPLQAQVEITHIGDCVDSGIIDGTVLKTT